MIKNVAVIALNFSLALLILTISIFRVAEIKYVLSDSPSPTPKVQENKITVDYTLPYGGKITPDSILWPIKALRDKIWLTLTLNPAKKADLYLLLADKRLAQAKLLFEKDKADLGLSVVTKAEKYLEDANNESIIAKSKGMDTRAFLQKYSLATLEHRRVLDEILAIAPEDAKPVIVKSEDYPKRLYQEAKTNLELVGLTAPEDPF